MTNKKRTKTKTKKKKPCKETKDNTAEHENRKPLFENKKTPKEKEKEKRNGRHTPAFCNPAKAHS